MIAYGINNHQAIEFIDKGKSFFVSDSSLRADQQKIQFHISPNRLNHGVSVLESQVPFATDENGLTLFQWQGKTIACLDEKTTIPKNSNFDYLIVSRNSLQREHFSSLKVKQIVFDGTNSRRYIGAISLIANNSQVRVHSVLKDGAFIIQ